MGRRTCSGPCSIEGCTGTARARALCNRHYSRLKRNGDTGPPGLLIYDPQTRDARGRKHCAKCDQWLPVESFGQCNQTSDGRRHACKACMNLYRQSRKWQKSPQQLKQMLSDQGGACAICGATEHGGRNWQYDHDHSCCPPGNKPCGECLRGVLCLRCNVLLGMAQDDPDRLTAAAAYLAANKKSQSAIATL